MAEAEAHLVMALQPVVEAGSGRLAGAEALIRGHATMGHDTPALLLDAAAAAGRLEALERLAARRAISAFAKLPGAADRRLFLNLDPRTLADPAATLPEELPAMLRAAGLAPSHLCVELTERQPIAPGGLAAGRLAALRRAGVRLALDDYGTGAAALSLLFGQPLDYLKLDRAFVRGVAADPRRRLFLGSIARFGRMLGLQVVAEGVEAEADLLACRELGCDLLQGWLPGRPSTDPAALVAIAPGVAGAIARDQRRAALPEPDRLLAVAEPIEAVEETEPLMGVIARLKRSPELAAIPVVDAAGAPLGVVREAMLRGLAYGRARPRDAALGAPVREAVVPCPVAEWRGGLDHVLQMAAANPAAPGVILTEAGRYRAWLSAAALLTLANEKRLDAALDQNPLTRLPGNRRVAQELTLAAQPQPAERLLCWFDFDGFKPFNDRFGFRLGDRAIVLFAETLQRHLPPGPGCFLGHVGGDDFFASLVADPEGAAERRIAAALAEFAESAALFYPPAEQGAGETEVIGRDGQPCRAPLLRCSAALLRLPEGLGADPDALSGAIAAVKKAAKRAEGGIARRVLGEPAD
jgi:EAL domain-containing protein (putative c-di-GMP-specific phosphodiesterase class I)/GGDEF domain-containing protein